MDARYRLVQPYGRNVGTESTTVSKHNTLEQALAELDRLSKQMLKTSGRGDIAVARS